MRFCQQIGSFCLAVVLSSHSAIAQPKLPIAKSPPTNRELFLNAEKALQQGRIAEFQRLKEQLKNYPLYPYLEFSNLSRHIKKVTLTEYQQFVRQYPNAPFTEQLQAQFLQNAAQQKDWTIFLAAYTPTNNQTLQCQYLQAQLHETEHQNYILSKISTLWLNSNTASSACEPIFTQFENSKHRTHALVWKKIKLSIEANNFAAAKRLSRYLQANEHPLIDLWIWVQKEPTVIGKQTYFKRNHPAILEILVSGITALAKSDPEKAIKVWKTLSKTKPFNDRHWGTVVREIALSFAKKQHANADKWLTNVPDTHADETVQEARIRVTIAKEDWPLMLHYLHRLPTKLKHQEQWQYWYGRALEKVGKLKESQQIFSMVAENRSYYGLLASQRMRNTVKVYHKKRTLTKPFLHKVSNYHAMLRVQELHALKRNQKAKTEWLAMIQNIDDEEKHAAAALALRWNMPNLAILALSQAKDNHDLTLRFPIVHKNTICSTAAKEKIDPAWIYAVTRQESAFMPNATSPAGAMGLMQLMPGTAKMVAKQKKIPFSNPRDLFHPETNIRLGSSYFRMMLETHKHPVLAIAAYNAGPNRIKQWLPNSPLPADSWIEIIPFTETREYVKNVLTYFVIYQQLLGNQPKLAHNMPMVFGDRS